MPAILTDQCPACGAEVPEGQPHTDPDDHAYTEWNEERAEHLAPGDRFVMTPRRAYKRYACYCARPNPGDRAHCPSHSPHEPRVADALTVLSVASDGLSQMRVETDAAVSPLRFLHRNQMVLVLQ